MPRPISTVAGVGLVLLRVCAGVLALVAIAVGWGDLIRSADVTIEGLDATAASTQGALLALLIIGATLLAIDAVLAFLIYRGLNWPRMVVMLISVISIASAFAAWWAVGKEITVADTFVSLSLDILILLALSSRSAAAYARRNQRP
jgi:hypothetical protein